MKHQLNPVGKAVIQKSKFNTGKAMVEKTTHCQ